MPSVKVCLATLAFATAAPVVAKADAIALWATIHAPIAQNRKADEDDLSRMRDAAMVRRFARLKLLVKVPARTRHYYLRRIPVSYQYLRPWSYLFLTRLSAQYYARFKKPLRVTSLVRSEALQRSLSKRNGNAAPVEGPRRSSHLTGATLDISKAPMTAAEIAWMRSVLSSLKAGGYLYAIEERQQPTFHIMVYKDYEAYVEERLAASSE